MRPSGAGAEQRATTERRLPGFGADRLDSLGLTRRELAVLERVAEGQTNEEIAEALRLSPLTVKKHLERMSLKLGAANRAALVALAWRQAAGDAQPRSRAVRHETRKDLSRST
jgi:DNA-binding CsgD family transcriptional regulator